MIGEPIYDTAQKKRLIDVRMCVVMPDPDPASPIPVKFIDPAWGNTSPFAKTGDRGSAPAMTLAESGDHDSHAGPRSGISHSRSIFRSCR